MNKQIYVVMAECYRNGLVDEYALVRAFPNKEDAEHHVRELYIEHWTNKGIHYTVEQVIMVGEKSDV